MSEEKRSGEGGEDKVFYSSDELDEMLEGLNSSLQRLQDFYKLLNIPEPQRDYLRLETNEAMQKADDLTQFINRKRG